MLIEEIINHIKESTSAEFNFKVEDFKGFKCDNCKFRGVYIASSIWDDKDKPSCTCKDTPINVDNYDDDFLCKYFETKK